MDDSGVRRRGGGGAGRDPDAADAQSDTIANRCCRVAYSAAIAVHRTLRRFSASR